MSNSNRTKGVIIALVVVAVILIVTAVAFSGLLSSTGGNTTTSHSTSQSVSTQTTSSSSSSSSSSQSSAGNSDLSLKSSGLVASDSLTTGNTSAWGFSGYSGTYSHVENSSGLFLSTMPQSSGTWAGSSAQMNVGSAQVYHAMITLPSSTIPSGYFNAGLLVQQVVTYPQNPSSVNYVSCGGGVNSGGYYWQVVSGTGNLSGAESTTPLYFSYNKPSLSQACTIITNGANLLEVYLGTTLVYTNSSMNLGISTPLNAFLQVTALNSTQSLEAGFTSFYASLNNTITVSGAPSGGKVAIVDSSNNVLANATVGANGIATINATAYQYPLSGNIQVYDSTGKLVASTTSAVTVWGGDAYSVG